MEEPKSQRTDKRTNRNGKGKDGGSDSPRSNGEDSPKNGRNGNGKPKNNGNSKNRSSFQNKKDEPQTSAEKKAIPPIGNERFDNAHTLGGGGPSSSVTAGHADAMRLADVIPNTTVSPEVDQQVRRILEVVPDLEYHVVYGALGDFKFDEVQTTNHFLNKRKDPATNWNNVVKKGLKPAAPQQNTHQNYPPNQGQNQHRKPKDEQRSAQQNHQGQHQQGHGQQGHSQQAPQAQQPAHYAPQHVQHPPQPEAQHVEAQVPEQIVYTLEEAISSQLQMIQQQTQMLHALQTELRNVTQGGGNEMQALIDDRELLIHRKREIQQELEHIENRLGVLDSAIRDKERMKNERLRELATKSAQLGFYGSPAANQRSAYN